MTKIWRQKYNHQTGKTSLGVFLSVSITPFLLFKKILNGQTKTHPIKLPSKNTQKIVKNTPIK